ncbi:MULTISPECIES: bifunctional 3-deoxy-7-phosphoheptulonate synthase/chorismate mutase type II [Nonlabens]|uniref:chorismate mutase n=3 Tax=Nonlabens ulvanivorans TaxID=906888 RepID=A0A090QBF9_NONUL|nr:bifunctional 3-deoxy-7-phosphoheptulonate synthase/chorismate mutase type II [Nonlabens ulvanivorans]WOI22714.1 bifunctional 3-deoxy-7-phosphoheptulonate synthase/chorismate mutase type II [Nonlabens ulvanivorans]GAK99118.1 2-keto-3-deoxy-D-arabino-heptulosonate-7-phosphate synthase I beta / chorismate mutase I [Nonlabens ulvanivorans]GAL75268.1 2-keto-3-deoxy-D-arabino-heptulosonate-7-phosphate synthase I beta [Nonlabens ulvanivorans]
MENKKEFRTWLDNHNLEHPIVIAGPCSAETEDQVLRIAHELKDSDVTYLRAGIWKPRTRPGNFEGVGAIGLKWLQKAKAETGLLTATEVANRAHVELALEHDIDLLWIGARSTVSPFIVQEIADALEGTDKVVLVKNPVNPDLALWIGAVERFHTANIKNLGVIHRGFSTYEKSKYRNIPEWQIAVDFQTRFPDIPLICDPSHITGKRDMIFEVSQTALDLNYDGLMIETHYDPDNAWSDAAQQVTPETLLQIFQDLRIRKEQDDEVGYQSKLGVLRAQIDVIDSNIIETLGKRMKTADAIGALKKERNVAVLQSKRWNEILGKMILAGEEQGLSEEFILRVFKAVHQESINHQEKVINK